jgi:succinate dehydrogenase/fumarate reductase cytochrome b subunit
MRSETLWKRRAIANDFAYGIADLKSCHIFSLLLGLLMIPLLHHICIGKKVFDAIVLQ